jgi:hypothetical protein
VSIKPGELPHSIVSPYDDSFGLADDETVLDGYTQPGSSPNTGKIGQPSNAVINIAITPDPRYPCGELAFPYYYPGLLVGGDRCVVRGITIGDDFCEDIDVYGADNVIEGCLLKGADTGIMLYGPGNRIGGIAPASRNLINGTGTGIRLLGSQSYPCTDTKIEGNYVGPWGDLTHGGNMVGIRVDGLVTGTVIGGHARASCEIPSSANIIAFNIQNGISIDASASGCSILSNIIHSNGGLGIDLGIDGATPNDNADVDAGPNMTQNYPVIQAAHGTVISGVLSSQGNKTYTIQVFDNSSCDPVAGEGKILFGETQATADGNGTAHFSVSCAAVRPGRFYTATATDEDGNTSEFSPCFAPVITATGEMPSRFALHGNVPNPFNPSTVIAYEIGAPGRVDIVIFDANGRRIRTLVSENRNTGSWTTQWDGRDESGQVVASGIYFCKMNAQGFESTQKMVLLK